MTALELYLWAGRSKVHTQWPSFTKNSDWKKTAWSLCNLVLVFETHISGVFTRFTPMY